MSAQPIEPLPSEVQALEEREAWRQYQQWQAAQRSPQRNQFETSAERIREQYLSPVRDADDDIVAEQDSEEDVEGNMVLEWSP